MGTAAMQDQGYGMQPGNVAVSNVNYIPPGFEGYYKEPFTYVVNFLGAVGGGVTTMSQVNVQNDSHFVCIAQNAFIVDAATGNTTITQPIAAPILVQVKDTSSGKYSMSGPTPISTLFGTGSQSFIWLYRAMVYRPGGQITVELTNNLAATQNVYLAFVGFKVYAVPDTYQQM